MINKKDIIGVGMLVLVLIVMLFGLVSLRNVKTGKATEYLSGYTIHCGNDINCLINASLNCTRSDILYSATADIFGVIINSTNFIELRQNNSQKCLYYQIVQNISVQFSNALVQQMLTSGMTLEQINQQQQSSNSDAQRTIGIEQACLFGNEDLTKMLVRWKDGNYSTSDFDVAECSEDNLRLLCDFNGICNGTETLQSCPEDCSIYICNNNSICESYENVTTCPNDCLCTPGENRTCYGGQGICSLSFQRCDNSSRNWSVCFVTSPVNETCNNLDDDCDGEIDEGRDWNNDGEIDDDERFDYDDDGYFPNRTITHDMNCTGYDSDEIDCNDLNGSIHPNAKEKLNGVDDDCDGLIDENISSSNITISYDKIDLGILKKEGSKAYLRAGDWATFKFNDIMGKIEVSSITNTNAIVSVTVITGTINVFSPSTLIIGQTADFDLDNNGKKDISITLDAIQSRFKTSLTIKDISELLSPPNCNNNNICDSDENAAGCPSDCLVVNYCNNNGVCEEKETIENCFTDCKPEEKLPAVEQPASLAQTNSQFLCNNNTLCEAWETKESCPADCKKFNLMDYKDVLIYAAATFLFLTIISGSIIMNRKLNPYRIRKSLRKTIARNLDLGYNLDTLGYYLQAQKLKPSKMKKALKYAADFMSLKQAVVFYLAQGHKEDEIRRICKKNKWAKRITNEVFDDIKTQQKNLSNNMKIAAKPNLQKYQIKGFNNETYKPAGNTNSAGQKQVK